MPQARRQEDAAFKHLVVHMRIKRVFIKRVNIKRVCLVAATACGLCVAASPPAVAWDYSYVYYSRTPYITDYEEYRDVRRHRATPTKVLRREVPHKPVAAIREPAAAIRKPVAALHPRGKEESPGALDVFLRDITLRRGDVVMTTSGLEVFQGDGLDHKASDFVPLAKAPWISRRAELISLQNASLQNARSHLVTGIGTAKFMSARARNPHLKTSYAEKAQGVRRIPGVPGFE